MKSFHTTIAIAATPERVWQLLTDVANWPRWNTTVEKVEGTAVAGGKVTVYTKSSSGRAFPLTVSEFLPPQRMMWTGGMPLGLFTGRRTYTITPNTEGRVTFTMTEEFTGLLAPLITRTIPDLQPTFDEFAACLKNVAETLSEKSP